MQHFRLSNILPGAKETLMRGTYIVLLDPLHLPPHLLVCHEGKLFSLSVSGRQLGSPLEKLLAWSERKKVPSLFIEWKLPAGSSAKSFPDLAQNSFSRYPRVEAGKVSCLFPIREMAAALHGEKMKSARFIFELLPLLKDKNAIGASYSFQLETTNNEFELLSYSEAELAAAILRTEPEMRNT